MRAPRTAGTFLMTKSDGILHKACRRIGATDKPNDTFRRARRLLQSAPK